MLLLVYVIPASACGKQESENLVNKPSSGSLARPKMKRYF